MAIRDRRMPEISEKQLVGTVWGPRPAEVESAGPRETTLVDVVPVERQNVAAATGFDVEIKGEWRVQDLIIDVPADVDADVYVNDQKRLAIKDRLGTSGAFRLGLGDGSSFMRVWKVRIVAFNQHATNSRDVRAWMVAV